MLQLHKTIVTSTVNWISVVSMQTHKRKTPAYTVVCTHKHIHGHGLWVRGVYMHWGCLSKLDQHGTISFFSCFVLHLHSPCPALSLNHSSLVIRLLPKTHTATGKAMQLRSFIKIRSMKIGFCLSVAQSTFVCKAHCPEIDTLTGVQQKVATTVWTDCREDGGEKKERCGRGRKKSRKRTIAMGERMKGGKWASVCVACIDVCMCVWTRDTDLTLLVCQA